jgi:BASS family bile acid:Na+ symporter
MTAHALFNAIFNASLVIMVTTLVASLGLGLTVRQILAPMNRVWLLLGTIVVNSILAPLIAIGICDLFPISSQGRTGLEVVTIAAAGPAGMKACEFAKRADMAMALSFTIVLQLVNIVAAPLWAKQIISGANVSLWSIVQDLLLLVLAPLVVGQLLRYRYPAHADGWKPQLEKISNIALVIALGVGIAVNWTLLVDALGSWVIVCSAVMSVAFALSGWVVGLRDRQAATTISMVSAMRFTPIGLVVIATVLHNQGPYLIPALIFGLVDTIIPFAIGLELGRLEGRTEPAAVRAGAAGVPHAT